MTSIILLALIGASEPTAEVFFDTDSARIPEATSDKLQKFVSYAAEHPEAKIVIDGNTDANGAADYNVRLSLRRAQAIQSQLKLMGVDGNQLIVVGYGEDGLRRTTKQLDRRVAVWTTTEPLYVIVDHALTRATSVSWEEPVQAAQIDGPRATQTAFR